MRLEGLVEVESSDNIGSAAAAAAGDEEAFKAQNVLHYKYIPRTGSPGIADVEYPTVSPVPASGGKVGKVFSVGKASVGFEASGFSELPTLHHIAQKLAGITVLEIVGGTMVVGTGGADFRAQRAIAV